MFVQLKSSFIALGVIFLFSMNSCTKFGKNITVKGYVLNPVTGKGFEGIDVWLQKSSGTFPGGYKNVKEAVTDANGYYEINAAALQDRYLRVSTSLEYYDIGWDSDAGGSSTGQLYIETGKTTWANYHIVPYGQLSLNIQNVNCQGPADSMYFRSKMQFESDYAYWSTLREGCYNYTSTGTSAVPMGYRYYETKVIRSGVTTYVYDTLFVSENGVSHLDILY